MRQPPYTYRAKFVDLYDGDTCTLDIDLGFGMTYRANCRLFGINTPELRGETREAGMRARDAAKAMLEGHDWLMVKTHKGQEKFGRWLAEISTPDSTATVNDRLVSQGHAVEYMRD